MPGPPSLRVQQERGRARPQNVVWGYSRGKTRPALGTSQREGIAEKKGACSKDLDPIVFGEGLAAEACPDTSLFEEQQRDNGACPWGLVLGTVEGSWGLPLGPPTLGGQQK